MAQSIHAAARERLVLARNEIDFAIAELDALAPPAPVIPEVAAPASPLILKKAGGIQNVEAFFQHVIGRLWPRMTLTQRNGCIAIMTACAGVFPTSWTAYALATAYLETSYTMQPIRERGNGDHDGDGFDDYFDKYDTGRKAAELGNTPGADGDGDRFRGRGYVQVTGTTNYRRATAELRALGILTADESLVDTPDLALRPDVAAAVMVLGMKEGWFTGKSLRDYIPATPKLVHFKNARRIINGTNKDDEIAGFAMIFYQALINGGWQ